MEAPGFPKLKYLTKVDGHEWAGEMTDGIFLHVRQKGGIIYLGAAWTPRLAENRCTEPVAEAYGEITEADLIDKLELQMEETHGA